MSGRNDHGAALPEVLDNGAARACVRASNAQLGDSQILELNQLLYGRFRRDLLNGFAALRSDRINIAFVPVIAEQNIGRLNCRALQTLAHVLVKDPRVRQFDGY